MNARVTWDRSRKHSPFCLSTIRCITSSERFMFWEIIPAVNAILSNKTSLGAKNNLQGVRGTHNCVVVGHARVHVLRRFSEDRRNR